MRKVTKEDFKFFDITDEQIRIADTLDKTKYELIRSNVKTGTLGEIIVSNFLGVPIDDLFDYDMIKDGKRIDAKSKLVKSFDPDLYHYCDVYNCTQKTDFYVFTQISVIKKRGCILGWISKEEFFDKAPFVKKDCKKPNDIKEADADLWCIRVSELYPFIDDKIIDTYSWDKHFMSIAYMVAMKSKDEKTQHATVIVGQDNRIKSTGYNSFPSGIIDYDPERQKRPEKYYWIEHSERNALYSAAKAGIALDGCKLYVTGIPCMDCARGIIQSGIQEVIYHDIKPYDSEKWEKHNKRTLTLFEEAGVEIREYKGPVINKMSVRRDGELIEV